MIWDLIWLVESGFIEVSRLVTQLVESVGLAVVVCCCMSELFFSHGFGTTFVELFSI